ncbi:hypothetical protein B0H10DRAFT_2001542 [Mycena sp. CBHHK59/15]|nr:hypothetical protein B0H10DRAFT_2001542 [Mycena sp. CBHHK59/15]
MKILRLFPFAFKLGRSIHLAIVNSAVQLGMGFVKNWGQLALHRVLFGLIEVGIYYNTNVRVVLLVTGKKTGGIMILPCLCLPGSNETFPEPPVHHEFELLGKLDIV